MVFNHDLSQPILGAQFEVVAHPVLDQVADALLRKTLTLYASNVRGHFGGGDGGQIHFDNIFDEGQLLFECLQFRVLH